MVIMMNEDYKTYKKNQVFNVWKTYETRLGYKFYVIERQNDMIDFIPHSKADVIEGI